MELINAKELNSGKSLTEINLPAYRRVSRMKSMMVQSKRQQSQFISIEQQQIEIKKTFTKLTGMINGLDNYFKSRIRIHQQQILKIVKAQLTHMQQQVQMIVSKYTDMIKTKNKDEDMKHLRNQIYFYRTNLQKAQDQINALKKTNKELSNKLELKDQNIFESQAAMKKIKIKMLRQKMKTQSTRKGSLEKIPPILLSHTKSQIDKFSSAKIKSTQLQSVQRNNTSELNGTYTQDIEQNLIKSSKYITSITPKIKLTNLRKISISKQNNKWQHFTKDCKTQDDLVQND